MLLAVCFFVELLRFGLGPVLQYPEVACLAKKYLASDSAADTVGEHGRRAASAEGAECVRRVLFHMRTYGARRDVLPLYPDVSKSPTGGGDFLSGLPLPQ